MAVWRVVVRRCGERRLPAVAVGLALDDESSRRAGDPVDGGPASNRSAIVDGQQVDRDQLAHLSLVGPVEAVSQRTTPDDLAWRSTGEVLVLGWREHGRVVGSQA